MQNLTKKKNLLIAYKKILLIRKTEELLAQKYLENKNSSFLHLSIGQEASAVGVCHALNKKDIVFGNHRSHGHYLAKGGNLSKLIFEVFGDTRGCCKGFGGSMHMLDKSVGFVGTTPILGSVPSIVSGMSMALKKANKKNIAVGFVGDGSAEEGTFYETLNLSCVHNLPVLMIVEDNGYSVEIPRLLRKSNKYDLKKIVSGIGAFYSDIDGQDFEKVFNETKKLKLKILNSKKPAVLRLRLLRRYAHSGYNEDIKSNYRIEKYSDHKRRDPIFILKKKLIKLNFKNIEKTEKEILKKVAHVFDQAYKKLKLLDN